MRSTSISYTVSLILLLLVVTVAGCGDTELPPFPGKKAISSAGAMGHGGAALGVSGAANLSGGFAGSPDGGTAPLAAGSTNGGAANEAGSNSLTAGGSGTAGTTEGSSESGVGGIAPLGIGGAENSSGGFTNTEGGAAPATGGAASSIGGTTSAFGGGNAGTPGGIAGATGGFIGIAGSPTSGGAGGPVATAAMGGISGQGGTAVGGAATGGAPTCDTTPSSQACGAQCVDISSDKDNCRACGHACGFGSNCIAGQCKPVLIYQPTTTITAFEADDTNILFSPTGIQACSAAGCAVTPNTVSSYSPGAERFLANGYVLVQIPNVGVTGRYTGYSLCPTTGCTTTNMIGFGATNQQVSIPILTASAHNFYKTMQAPPGSSINYCGAPVTTGCTTSGGVLGFSPSSLVVSDSAVFFNASIGGTSSTLYACGVADMGTCTPTPVNLPSTLVPEARVIAAYGDDLYFYQPVAAPPNTIPTLRKCPRTGCAASSGVSLGQVSGSVDEMEIDASGVYWTSGSNIKMCPLSGCVGAPFDVATSVGSPTMLRLNTSYVYWVNTADNAIHRVAKPAI